jgi:hypothetical protein
MNKQFDFDTVVKLYNKHYEKQGFIPQQPSLNESYEGRKYFYLMNCNGLIAKFNKKDELFV